MRTYAIFVLCFAVLLLGINRAGAACQCDCNDDGVVAIAEIIQAVNVALGRVPADRCPNLGTCPDCSVAVVQLIDCVRRILDGCDEVPNTATPSPTPTAALPTPAGSCYFFLAPPSFSLPGCGPPALRRRLLTVTAYPKDCCWMVDVDDAGRVSERSGCGGRTIVYSVEDFATEDRRVMVTLRNYTGAPVSSTSITLDAQCTPSFTPTVTHTPSVTPTATSTPTSTNTPTPYATPRCPITIKPSIFHDGGCVSSQGVFHRTIELTVPSQDCCWRVTTYDSNETYLSFPTHSGCGNAVVLYDFLRTPNLLPFPRSYSAYFSNDPDPEYAGGAYFSVEQSRGCTRTPTRTPTKIHTKTPTRSPTQTPTPTKVKTKTPTRTVTKTRPIPTATPTRSPTPVVGTINGCVGERPDTPCGQVGVLVKLEPGGRRAATSIDGRFHFDGVAPGAYTLRVEPPCNHYGCWRVSTVDVGDVAAFVSIANAPRAPIPTTNYQVPLPPGEAR